VLAGHPGDVTALLERQVPTIPRETGGARGTTRRLPGRFEYERGVEACKEHIRRGDAFQIVLSQRAERRTDVSPLSVYRSLRRVNPSPYLFLLELDGVSLVGSSPETLVKLEGARAPVQAMPSACSPPRRTAPST
jgi:anthranilate synthase component I